MPPTRAQLLSVADDVIAAFKIWTLDAVMPLHAPDCVSLVLPSSLGIPPQTNDEVALFLAKNMTLTTTPWTVEYDRNRTAVDVEKRKVVLYVKMQIGTIVGDFRNEYVFSLVVNEEGTLIERWEEFMDSHAFVEIFKKVEAAQQEQEKQA